MRIVADTVAERSLSDPRVQRTRAALLSAFNRLFLEHGYDAITPARIAAAAGVGRSTFYEHHTGKEALFRHSVTPVLHPLAQVCRGGEPAGLVAALRHFWHNRRLARRLLAGRTGMIIRDQLAGLIEQTLPADRMRQQLPPALVAIGMAAAQLAMVEAWLTGHHACTAEQLSQAMIDDARRYADGQGSLPA